MQEQVQEYTFDLDIFSDLHKDAYGFRPRGDYFEWLESASDEARQAEWDCLLRTLKHRIEEDDLADKAAIERFEQHVTNTICAGAKDRETALRWIMSASQCNGDWEFLCYDNGLPYGYFKKTV